MSQYDAVLSDLAMPHENVKRELAIIDCFEQSNIANSSVFNLESQDLNSWLDLSNSFLIVKDKLTQGGAAPTVSALTTNPSVTTFAARNNFPAFDRLELRIDGVLVQMVDHAQQTLTVKALCERSDDYVRSNLSGCFVPDTHATPFDTRIVSATDFTAIDGSVHATAVAAVPTATTSALVRVAGSPLIAATGHLARYRRDAAALGVDKTSFWPLADIFSCVEKMPPILGSRVKIVAYKNSNGLTAFQSLLATDGTNAFAASDYSITGLQLGLVTMQPAPQIEARLLEAAASNAVARRVYPVWQSYRGQATTSTSISERLSTTAPPLQILVALLPSAAMSSTAGTSSVLNAAIFPAEGATSVEIRLNGSHVFPARSIQAAMSAGASAKDSARIMWQLLDAFGKTTDLYGGGCISQHQLETVYGSLFAIDLSARQAELFAARGIYEIQANITRTGTTSVYPMIFARCAQEMVHMMSPGKSVVTVGGV
jgi:hypothetical protein